MKVYICLCSVRKLGSQFFDQVLEIQARKLEIPNSFQDVIIKF